MFIETTLVETKAVEFPPILKRTETIKKVPFDRIENWKLCDGLVSRIKVRRKKDFTNSENLKYNAKQYNNFLKKKP